MARPRSSSPPDPASLARSVRKGRGAASNADGRFEPARHEPEDDGWGGLDEPLVPLATTLGVDSARSVITRNDSPDIPFDRSINPYRGCEHGCIYCYARPSHAYLGLSPGLDFETRLYAKPDAAARLADELRAPGYCPQPIALGTNTDPYQPVERRTGITRAILEVLARCEHPLTIVTKSALIERDLDLLGPMAQKNLVKAFLSVTTLKRDLARRLEPRAAAPERRLEAIARLSQAGIPVGVMVAPVIPVLTDGEIEAILAAAREAGAREAGYILLRLPREVKDLFKEWLALHAPLSAAHVMARLREARGGREYDARFGVRMRGEGEYADLIRARFALACRRLGLDRRKPAALDLSRFRPPPSPANANDATGAATGQLDLFEGP
ncbi:radical SAM protein [Sulfurifustis variabilis]|uniref:Radical SAM protein n=1 Tax=Sulfurifustis variabilis TaxID=1675686 RepID=A0A1B4V740_9GAMM|nr:PA0069 family radical SAM protein [Sulfurifustis variabilis]BAU47124.1 radical SAM protein [Sulfurifustis variabilis]